MKKLYILFLLFICVISGYSQSYPQSAWQVLPKLPFTQQYHVTVGWKNADTTFIYTIGGRVNNVTSRVMLRYNTVTQTYTQLAQLPEALERAGGFVMGDSIFVVGGASGLLDIFGKKVYKYNIRTNTWTQRNNFPLAIGEITQSSVSLNNRYAYVVCGFTGLVSLNNVYIYDVYSDKWSAASLLPTIGLFGTSVSLLNDSTLFVAGGRSLLNIFSSTFIGKINKLNPSIISWTKGPKFPGGTLYNIASWGNRKGRIFFTGGSRGLILGDYVQGSSDETYMYSEDSGEYDTLEDKPTPITHTQIYGSDSYNGGITHNEVYAPGGATGSSGDGTNANEKLVVDDTVSSTSAVISISEEIPDGFKLNQNYPNPFNPSTSIEFQLPERGFVTLKVYSILGTETAALINGELNAGVYRLSFDASNLPGGVYFYTLKTAGFSETKKMLLVK